MMFSTRQLITTALTCTAAMALTTPTVAQTYPAGQVNVSGATLFRDFFTFPASTNDYIDVDGDGNAGSLGTFPPPQLAGEYNTLPLDINASMTQRIRPTLFALGTASTVFSICLIGLFIVVYSVLYRRSR